MSICLWCVALCCLQAEGGAVWQMYSNTGSSQKKTAGIWSFTNAEHPAHHSSGYSVHVCLCNQWSNHIYIIYQLSLMSHLFISPVVVTTKQKNHLKCSLPSLLCTFGIWHLLSITFFQPTLPLFFIILSTKNNIVVWYSDHH